MKNNIVFKYFTGSFDELKRVSWPTRKEVLNHTIIVLVSSAIAVIITAAIDYGLTYIIQYLVENKK